MFRPTDWRTWGLIGLLLIAVASSIGCDDEPAETPTEAPAQPRAFASKAAPYALTLGGSWNLEDPSALNEFADLAASYKNTLYLIVIPQKLPQIPDVEPPNALALRRASVSVMQEQIKDFEIERQGPVRVAGHMGQTVFAHGVVDAARVKYVTTYVTRGPWGFQIVAWGPSEKAELLVSQIDQVLATWTFTDGEPSATGAEPLEPAQNNGETPSP